MTFIQIIEFETSRAEQVKALFSEWMLEGEQHGLVRRVIHSIDRDQSKNS